MSTPKFSKYIVNLLAFLFRHWRQSGSPAPSALMLAFFNNLPILKIHWQSVSHGTKYHLGHLFYDFLFIIENFIIMALGKQSCITFGAIAIIFSSLQTYIEYIDHIYLISLVDLGLTVSSKPSMIQTINSSGVSCGTN